MESEKKENTNNQNGVVSSEISALDVAKYLIGLAQRDGNPITNLRLQKLLYYAWGTYWNIYKKHLFNDPIEAWDYGPVVRDVYIEYCESKKDELTLNSETIALTDKKISKSIKEFLQAFFGKYKDISTYALIKGSHEEAPWKETYKVGEKNIISQEKMEKFFNTIN